MSRSPFTYKEFVETLSGLTFTGPPSRIMMYESARRAFFSMSEMERRRLVGIAASFTKERSIRGYGPVIAFEVLVALAMWRSRQRETWTRFLDLRRSIDSAQSEQGTGNDVRRSVP